MSSTGVGRALDLSLGFNNPNFSDRILLLEIIDGDDVIADHPVRSVKRRRRRRRQRRASTGTTLHTLFSPRMKIIHITSLVLAASSPFFLKLFSNGMQESKQKHVTLRIKALEEVSFMDLLKYVYSNNLPTTLDALLHLLVIADKFEVDSCLIDCAQALQKLPMTYESALLYLDLPPSLLMSSTVQPLIVAAKQFLVEKFKNFHESKEEILNLPLPSFQAVLSSDDLLVNSEYAVFDAVITWAQNHYPILGERQEILKTHLLHLIRFPFMTTTELTEEVQDCSDIEPELASKIVVRALRFKAETNFHRKRCLAAEKGYCVPHQFVKRAYNLRPVKVIEFELPYQQCVAYIDFTRGELKSVPPNGGIWSEIFQLGVLDFNFIGRHYVDKPPPSFRLGLRASDSSVCTVKYEFSIRGNPRGDFRSWFKGCHTFTKTRLYEYFHAVKWTEFIGDDSSYFINDILHLRVELTIMK